jgi:hypothetical protein
MEHAAWVPGQKGWFSVIHAACFHWLAFQAMDDQGC